MRPFSITLFALLFLFFGENWGHAQSSLHITSANSPYIFPNGYEVAIGDSLILHPGAEVQVGPNANITVHGIFRSLGNTTNPITIAATDPSLGWGVLDIRNTSDSLLMQYTFVNEGRLAVNDVYVSLYETHITNNQQLLWDDMVFRAWFAEVIMTYSSIKGSNQGEGLICHDCVTPTITHCTFISIPDAVELINCQNGLIRNNVFRDLGDDAIDLNHCSNVLIDSNLIYNISNRGIEIGSESFGSCTDITVSRNRFSSCSEGVNFKEGSTGLVINNTFHKNDIAITTVSAPGFDQEKVDVINCIFNENNYSAVEDENAEVRIRYSSFSDNVFEGEGNFQVGPRFVDANNLDFHLKPSSLCINTGALSTGLDPDGTRMDLGAYYQPVFDPEEHASGIVLRPNPSRGVIYLHLTDSYETVSVYGGLGKPLIHFNIQGELFFTKDLSFLASGKYYLLFSSPQKSATLPLVVF